MHSQIEFESYNILYRLQATQTTLLLSRMVDIQPIILVQCLVTINYPFWHEQIELFKMVCGEQVVQGEVLVV